MKRFSKKLIAITMIVTMIVSFISEIKLYAEEMVEISKTGNIILYENKDVGITYSGNGEDVNLYQIARKGASGFKLVDKYKDFFGNISDMVKDSSNTQQTAYAKYDTETCSLNWMKDEPKEYDFKFEWKGIVLDKENIELEFLSMGINTSDESTRLSECLHHYCNNSKNSDNSKKVSPLAVTLEYVKPNPNPNDESYYKFKNLLYGYYLIDINVKAKDNKFVGMPSILVTLDEKTASQDIVDEKVEKNLRVNPKGKLPTIEKYIYNKDGLNKLNKKYTSQIGGEIRYMIVYDLPDLRNTTITDKTIYKIYDTMEQQTFKEGSLKLSIIKGIDDVVDWAKEGYYTFKFEDEQDQPDSTKKKFSIQLTPLALTEIKKNYEKWDKCMIVADYTTILDEDAKFKNNNTTYLKYGDNETEKSTAQVYTYKMNIKKLFSDGSTDFRDVEFKLYDEKKEKAYKFKKDTSGNGETTTSSDKYIPANNEQGFETLKPDNNGNIEIFGLDAGTYWLVETKTKNGFKKQDFKVTIKPTFEESTEEPILSIEEDEKKYVSILEDSNTQVGVNVEVVNRADSLLPETGSIGTILFTVVGLSLIALSISMYKKNKEN